jgi:hypothetical protein
MANYEAVSDEMLEELEFSDKAPMEVEPAKPAVIKTNGGLYGDFSFVLDIYINDGDDIEGDYYENGKNPYVSYGSVAEEDFLELAMHEATRSAIH